MWDSSLVLSRYLEKHVSPKFWKGKHVIELGAGTGIVGLTVAGIGGVEQVLLTDLPDLKPLLKENVKLNKKITKGCQVQVVEFEWGNDEIPRLISDQRKSWRTKKNEFLKRLSVKKSGSDTDVAGKGYIIYFSFFFLLLP